MRGGTASTPEDDRPGYLEAIERVGVLRALAPFAPRIAGTPPLGLDLPSSDIDILCHAPDAAAFTLAAWEAFGGYSGFLIRQWTGADRPVVCNFTAQGWPFEIFGQALPVDRQQGWRHFLVERRLLEWGGPAFRSAVMAARSEGAKTEPAFAAALRLPGDPYEALLTLEAGPDDALRRLLGAAGYRA
nr:DUF4269 domain-containing protein [uncultured Roseococcus sp.]